MYDRLIIVLFHSYVKQPESISLCICRMAVIIFVYFCCMFESHLWWGEKGNNSEVSQDWFLQRPQIINKNEFISHRKLACFMLFLILREFLPQCDLFENRVPQILWFTVKTLFSQFK